MVYKKVKRYVKKGASNIVKYVKKDPVGAATKALSMAKYLHGIINSELKSVQHVYGVQYISWNGSIYHMSDVVQGDQHNQRNGMSILGKYLTINGTMKLQGSTQTNVITLYVVLDVQRVYGSTPGVSDFLDSTGGYQVTNSMIQVNSRGRFKILKKMRFVLNNNGREQKCFQINIKNINKHIKWGYASTNELQNHVYFIAVSDHDATDTGNIPRLDFNARFKYYDN